jgi:hypothetical protein
MAMAAPGASADQLYLASNCIASSNSAMCSFDIFDSTNVTAMHSAIACSRELQTADKTTNVFEADKPMAALFKENRLAVQIATNLCDCSE